MIVTDHFVLLLIGLLLFCIFSPFNSSSNGNFVELWLHFQNQMRKSNVGQF